MSWSALWNTRGPASEADTTWPMCGGRCLRRLQVGAKGRLRKRRHSSHGSAFQTPMSSASLRRMCCESKLIFSSTAALSEQNAAAKSVWQQERGAAVCRMCARFPSFEVVKRQLPHFKESLIVRKCNVVSVTGLSC